MGAFASYLRRAGVEVTGSDQNVYPPMSDVLRAANITLFEGYRAENLTALPEKPDLVVIGNVVRATNPEAQAALQGGYTTTSLPEAMERFLLKNSRNLVVAGTHGKTTTSSMLAHVLAQSGRDPSYFIGGVPADLPHSFHVSQENRYFVLEGDEYDTAFWDKVPKFFHYLPDDVILTSIEYDHADIYPDLAAVVRAFEGLKSRIREGGRAIVCVDYPETKRWAESFDERRLLTYGLDASARFRPTGIQATENGIGFTIEEQLGGVATPVAKLQLRIPGVHNVLNALSVWILTRALGLSDAEIARGLASFRGVKRRQEVRGEVRGVTVVDDFAHHPTAVRETLAAFRAQYPKRRILTIFEPRSATSRRKVFQKDYAQAFSATTACWIAKPYDQTSISGTEHFSSENLVEDLRAQGVDARVMQSVETGVVEVSKACQAGDLVLVLSNGGFGGFIPKLLEALATP